MFEWSYCESVDYRNNRSILLSFKETYNHTLLYPVFFVGSFFVEKIYILKKHKLIYTCKNMLDIV